VLYFSLCLINFSDLIEYHKNVLYLTSSIRYVSIEHKLIRLLTPTNYTVFSGDIPVKLTVPRNISLVDPVVIELVSLPTNHVLTSIDISQEYKDVEMLLINCRAVNSAGLLQFRLLESTNSSVVAKSAAIRVVWPRVVLALPKHTRTLAGDVNLLILIEEPFQCNSSRPNAAQYIVELNYFTRLRSDVIVDAAYFNAAAADAESTTVVSVTNQSVSLLTSNNVLTFSCSLFELVGFYLAVLRSSRHDVTIPPLARSNPIAVDASDAYSVKTLESAIFPCTAGVVVKYTRPVCAGAGDRIRLFIQPPQKDELGMGSHPAAEVKYVAERRIKSTDNAVSFSCSLFRDTVLGYCFKYISVASNGVSQEQGLVCLPTVSRAGLKLFQIILQIIRVSSTFSRASQFLFIV